MLDLLPGEVRTCILQVLRNLESIVSIISSKVLREAVSTYVNNPGKLIRPTLCILTTYLFEGDLRKSIDAATAIECIHIASLLQDDVIDKHHVRRGVSTPFSRFGTEISMLASNVFIAKAIEYSLRTGIPEVQMELIRVALALTDGAALEVELEQSDKMPSFQEYMRIVLRKTASLIEASMVLGALIANIGESLLHKVRIIGRLLGVTYQIRDDLLDYLEADRLNPGRGDKLNVVRVLEKSGLSRDRAIISVLSLLQKLGRSVTVCIRRVFGSRASLLMQLVRNIVSDPYNVQFT